MGYCTDSMLKYLSSEVYQEQVQIGHTSKFKYNFRPLCGGFAEVSREGEYGCVRYDFNPNTLDNPLEALKFIRCTMLDDTDMPNGGVRFSRVDIAIDYHDVPSIQSADWLDKQSRKTVSWYSRNGQLESLYIGAPSSARRIRVYDKAKEQKEEGNWWRVESQLRLRPGDDLEKRLENPFEDIVGVVPNRQMLSVQERAMLYYLQAFPEQAYELDKKTRLKYKNMRFELDTRVLVPQEDYVKRKQHVLDVLDSWLAADLFDDDYGIRLLQ